MGGTDVAIFVAGAIGVSVAAIHAVVMQRRIIAPLTAHLAEQRLLTGTAERILAPLLHVSSVAWLAGGVALILAALFAPTGTKLALSILVGALYLHAALLNGIASRFRHPGWMLMALTTTLLAYAVSAIIAQNG